LNEVKDKDYAHRLLAVDGLDDLVKKYHPEVKGPEKLFYMEFVLHGLAEFSQLNKHQLETGVRFKDLLGAMFDMSGGEN
jgi:magnesium chelatase subunit I